jgi:hypothetical protein
MISRQAAADTEVSVHSIWFILVGALVGRFRRESIVPGRA